MPDNRPRYEQIDHTADVGLLVRGETLHALFEDAAAGLFDVITDRSLVESREERTVVVGASDREDLLVCWLSELNFLFSTEGALFSDFKVLEIDEKRLEARVTGEALDPARHAVRVEVKAVTYHRLRVEAVPSGWEAVVFFDI